MYSFLEFAEAFSGKFIIRINLWDPEDVQGSAQSETRVEFSLDLPYSSYFKLFFSVKLQIGITSCEREGQTFITVTVSLI